MGYGVSKKNLRIKRLRVLDKVFIPLWLLIFFNSYVFSQETLAAKNDFFLTQSISELPKYESKSNFDCSGDIYFVAMGGVENERLYDDLSLVWTDPYGVKSVIQRKVFSRLWTDSIARWGGLRLPKRKPIGMLGAFQGELEKFNGEWSVSLFHRGEKISQKSFFVTC